MSHNSQPKNKPKSSYPANIKNIAVWLLYWIIEWHLKVIAAVQCHYDTVNFLQNVHKRHPIACLWGEIWGAFCECKPASVTAVMNALWCFIAPHNDTRLCSITLYISWVAVLEQDLTKYCDSLIWQDNLQHQPRDLNMTIWCHLSAMTRQTAHNSPNHTALKLLKVMS